MPFLSERIGRKLATIKHRLLETHKPRTEAQLLDNAHFQFRVMRKFMCQIIFLFEMARCALCICYDLGKYYN